MAHKLAYFMNAIPQENYTKFILTSKNVLPITHTRGKYYPLPGQVEAFATYNLGQKNWDT